MNSKLEELKAKVDFNKTGLMLVSTIILAGYIGLINSNTEFQKSIFLWLLVFLVPVGLILIVRYGRRHVQLIDEIRK